jgi:hypothetical protein
MKAMYVKLALLLALTLLFVWSHKHYTELFHDISDKIVVMQYKVLDKRVWTMSDAEKEAALMEDSSYGQLQLLEQQKEDARGKSEIGFWLAGFFIVATALYLLYTILRLAYLYLVEEEGYKRIVRAVRGSGQDEQES